MVIGTVVFVVYGQFDELAVEIAKSVGNINDKITIGQLASRVAKSTFEPYKCVLNNIKYIFTKNPTDAEVKKFGVKLGDILQSVAVPGPGGALATVLKFAPKLNKLMKKLEKYLVIALQRVLRL
ncbi:hypothetical protein [Paenibacillus sinopodophylli]|uniref:hypothetical protein n=1 Tax=Paenibacillus sinopodophylli TaxID=1837342 RepID=UPI00319DC883